MAKRRKAGPILAVAGVVVVGALAYSTLSDSGGSKTKVADTGGGAVSASPGPPAPYAISTLGAIGTAAQDPGGGGGGTGVPGSVGNPAIQGAQGSGTPQGAGSNGDRLYFSGVNLLDPNPAAATSGETTFPSPGSGVAGAIGPVTGPSSTGCATSADEADYYAIPLQIETITFAGAPRVHIRISGSGPVTASLVQQAPNNGGCLPISSGSGGISGGVSDFSLSGAGNFRFRQGYTPALVIKAPTGQHTISTSPDNPSYIVLPNLTGV
jgi:hypothetical protein